MAKTTKDNIAAIAAALNEDPAAPRWENGDTAPLLAMMISPVPTERNTALRVARALVKRGRQLLKSERKPASPDYYNCMQLSRGKSGNTEV